jgi:hypothetical protein
VAGFAPLRTSADDGAESLAHYAHVHGLLPRLGFFLGQEQRVPIDYDEIIALAAPRPVLIVAPTLDRHAPVQDVAAAVSAARRISAREGTRSALMLETPAGFGEFTPAVQEQVAGWLRGLK